jgi:MFS family permease
MNFSVIIPILPFILRQYGGNPFIYGILLSAYPFFQFFAAPILGSLSDFYGRRPILLISQAGTLLSWVIFASAFFIPNVSIGLISLPIIVLLIARIADGITGGNNAVANAYTSDIVSESERTRVFGYLGGVSGIGMIVGPVIGGFMMTPGLGYFGPVILSVLISAIALILMYFFMPETLNKDKRLKRINLNVMNELQFLPKLKKYAQDRVMKYILFKRVIFLLVFSSFVSVFPLYLVDVLNLGSQQIGFVFVGVGAILFLNQIYIAGPVVKKYGEVRALIIGLIILSVSQALLSFSSLFWEIAFLIYFNNLGITLVAPTFKTLLSKRVEQDKQGEIMGLDESLISATSAIAPLVSTWIYGFIGPMVFVIQAMVVIIALYLYFTRKGWQK